MPIMFDMLMEVAFRMPSLRCSWGGAAVEAVPFFVWFPASLMLDGTCKG